MFIAIKKPLIKYFKIAYESLNISAQTTNQFYHICKHGKYLWSYIFDGLDSNSQNETFSYHSGKDKIYQKVPCELEYTA